MKEGSPRSLQVWEQRWGFLPEHPGWGYSLTSANLLHLVSCCAFSTKLQ